MALSDKNRKILWGRSGNRCAMCRRELVAEACGQDEHAVIGEECHIASGKPSGPRYAGASNAEAMDSVDNLILLCNAHHKMIDDQYVTYTVEALRALKQRHEAWVSHQLQPGRTTPRWRLVLPPGAGVDYLARLTTSRDVMGAVEGTCMGSFDHDEPECVAEADLLGEFLQEARDWAEMSVDMDQRERVHSMLRLRECLDRLEAAGFWVFGGREMHQLAVDGEPPANWPVAIIRVVRATSPAIVAAAPDPAVGSP